MCLDNNDQVVKNRKRRNINNKYDKKNNCDWTTVKKESKRKKVEILIKKKITGQDL